MNGDSSRNAGPLTETDPGGYTMYIRTGVVMIGRIQKWGNSQGVRITRAMLEQAGLAVGEEVDMVVDDGRILLTPLRRVRGGHRLEDLVSRISGSAPAEEVDWGGPVGKEEW